MSNTVLDDNEYTTEIQKLLPELLDEELCIWDNHSISAKRKLRVFFTLQKTPNLKLILSTQ